MAIRSTHKCHTCGEIFRNEEMVNYATIRSKTSYWYCKKCYEEKIWREKFIDKVCVIFGAKAPGSKVWKQREWLQKTYGYSDEILIDCLDYIYNIKKIQKLDSKPTLGLIKPAMIDQMMCYKRQEKIKATQLVNAAQTEYVEHIVPVEVNKKKIKDDWDPEEWLS